LEAFSVRNLSNVKIVYEVLFRKDGSEFSIERSTVRHESRSLGNITSKSNLLTGELGRSFSPCNLVISKRINKLGGLVHLSLKLVSISLHLVLNSLLLGVHSIESSLLLDDSIEFNHSSLKLVFSNSEFTSLLLE